ncbi:MAG: mercury(II) reductase [Promethearchaeota archaeon]
MNYDLIIIGAGAAGFAAAMKANELEAKTLLINNDIIGLGGTCVNVGCVPTKYLLNIAKIFKYFQTNNFYGLELSSSFDFGKIINGKNALIKDLRKQKYKKVLNNLSNIKFIHGNAKFISENEIVINNKDIYKGKRFIIATGSSPFIPPIDGLPNSGYLTNITALQLKKVPETLAILGGGALGIEFAQLFSRFGSKVIIFEMMDKIIPNEEPEISDSLKKYLIEDDNIDIRLNAKVVKIEKNGDNLKIYTEINGKINYFNVEKILVATGRMANTQDLGIENTNIRIGKKGEIIVDEYLNTSENIWAAGDVIGEPMLETVAAREGMIAANNALSENKIKMDYRIVPHAIFTDPQVGSIGLTDLEANNLGFSCNCQTILIKLVPKANIIHDTRGVIKMVINKDTEEILGIHILSDDAANIIHEGVMIIKNRMRLDDVINTLHIFPTFSEAIKLVAQSFKRDISNMTCCAE